MPTGPANEPTSAPSAAAVPVANNPAKKLPVAIAAPPPTAPAATSAVATDAS